MIDSSLNTNSSTPVLSIVNVSSGISTKVQATGYFVAVLPGTL
ncbi:MAG TPA: hypothetical protein VNU19_03450 [Candidatus Acidoferrum sp.]|nr:hypothetical protein [Candidatus Acidoferrum sp.]